MSHLQPSPPRPVWTSDTHAGGGTTLTPLGEADHGGASDSALQVMLCMALLAQPTFVSARVRGRVTQPAVLGEHSPRKSGRRKRAPPDHFRSTESVAGRLAVVQRVAPAEEAASTSRHHEDDPRMAMGALDKDHPQPARGGCPRRVGLAVFVPLDLVQNTKKGYMTGRESPWAQGPILHRR